MNRAFVIRSLIVIVLLMFLAGGCSRTVKEAAVRPVKVEGVAMEPALKDGDRILINADIDSLKHGDIILFHFPEDPSKSYIKRVIAVSGETVEVREHKVLINGNVLDEPYVSTENNQLTSDYKEKRVPDRSYFVLGDNRDQSSDSRTWGMLDRKFIYGKFVSKYYSAN